MSRAVVVVDLYVPDQDEALAFYVADLGFRVLTDVPKAKVTEVARMLKAIHAQVDRKAAQTKTAAMVTRLKAMRLKAAAELVEQQAGKRLTDYAHAGLSETETHHLDPVEEAAA